MGNNPFTGSVELIQDSFYTKKCTDKEYFQDHPNHVSNSALGLINYAQSGSPQRFIDGFTSNKSPALELGSAVHKMILEGDLYTISPVEKPSGKVGDIIDTIFKLKSEKEISDEEVIKEACIINDYYKGDPGEKRIAEIWNKGTEYLNFLRMNDDSAIILTGAMKSKLVSCCTSLKANRDCMNALFPKGQETYKEYPIFGEAIVKLTKYDEELDFTEEQSLIIPLKAKIDFFSIDHINRVVNLTDLKTTGTPVALFMGYYSNQFDGKRYVPTYVPGSYQKYRYYRQMALYSDMLMAQLLKENIIDNKYKLNINMACVETNNPFGSFVFPVDNYSLKEGRSEYMELLKIVAYHKINGFDKVIMANDIRR